MDTKSLFTYFPKLTDVQRAQFEQLKPLYEDWNSKINVISRKDMEHFYEHHVLHSLAIAKYIEFLPGMRVMDLGTGGGFPGIPLAILYPQTDFYLIDGTGKKNYGCQRGSAGYRIDQRCRRAQTGGRSS